MKPIARPDRKRAESLKAHTLKTRQKIESAYQALIETSLDAVVLSDQNGIIMMLNKRLALLHGYDDKRELIGKCAFELFTPEERPRAVENIGKAIEAKSGEIGKFECILLRKDGTRFWGELHGQVVVLPDVDLPLMLTIVRDVTERKRAEKELQESKERYENFISQISDGIYRFELDEPMPLTLSVDDQIEYLYGHMYLAECNPSFLAMYGINEMKDIIGKTQNAVFIGIDNPSNRAAKRNFINSGYRIKNQSTEEIDRQGNKKYFNNHVIGIVEKGLLLRMWGTQTDVTERRQAEDALRESEEKYRTLVEKANEAITIAQDGVFVFANKKAADLVGQPVGGLEGKPFLEYVWPEDRDMVGANYGKRVGGEPALDNYDFRIIGAGGAPVWVILSAAKILWKGKPATLNLLTDITERKAAAEDTLMSLREKEALLKEIHHRVKNNMQVISSLFNLQIAHTLNEECRDILKESQNRIRSMSLVHEKLYHTRDLSRIGLDSYIQNMAIHLFNAILTDIGQVRLEPNLEDVTLDINSAVPCGLILNELISNALQHGFPGGRKGTIRIGLKRGPDEAIVLLVADDGIGFPQEIDIRHPQSFGLQIVNLLIDQLDGSVELDRSSGTAFTVTFRELKYAPRI